VTFSVHFRLRGEYMSLLSRIEVVLVLTLCLSQIVQSLFFVVVVMDINRLKIQWSNGVRTSRDVRVSKRYF